MGSARSLWGIGLTLLAASSCLVSTDENLWQKRRDGAREQPTPDAPRDLPADAPPDAPLLDARRDDRLDRGDGLSLDLSRDAKKADSKPDLAGKDAPPPDKPKPDLKPDVKKPDTAVCKQVVMTVSAQADDGGIWNTIFAPDGDPANNKLWCGYWDGSAEWCFFRFALPQAIPAKATVTSAVLSLWGIDIDSNWDPLTHGLEVWVENSGDAAAVTGIGDAPLQTGGRPVVSMIRWPAVGGVGWKVGQYNTSNNLAAAFQTVVTGKAPLAAGIHLQVWVRGAQAAQADIALPDYAYVGYSTMPSKLTLGWCQ
jgi:hypothetical protein